MRARRVAALDRAARSKNSSHCGELRVQIVASPNFESHPGAARLHDLGAGPRAHRSLARAARAARLATNASWWVSPAA